MPNTLQEYLARVTQKTAADIEAALLKLPEERRNWSPGGEARTAADMVAECAILNGTTADAIINRAYPLL